MRIRSSTLSHDVSEFIGGYPCLATSPPANGGGSGPVPSHPPQTHPEAPCPDFQRLYVVTGGQQRVPSLEISGLGLGD